MAETKKKKQNLKNNKKKRSGLRIEFLTMTILPLLILGIFIVGMGASLYTKGLNREVQNGLVSVGRTVLAAYENNYEGDFNLLVNEETGEMYLRKGTTIISENHDMIDAIKRDTGIDVSLFFYNIRLMTTITDAEGNRAVNVTCHRQVESQVLKEKQECFFRNVQVEGTDYFAEYIPLFGSDGTCIGMIGAAKPATEVKALINESLISNMLLIILAVLLVAFVINRFTAGLVRTLRKMMHFLGAISEGNLDANLDETILSRDDEIGEMGRFTVHVQAALRKLIERDALTSLYNRRSGEKKIKQVLSDSRFSAVAMADIDFFKKVNDTYGHEAGDDVLRVVARTLNEGMKGHGFAARWGGEEFLLVFDHEQAYEASEVMMSILQILRETTVVSGEFEINVTMSMGVVTGNMIDSSDVQIKRADEGLYYAKTHGRNQVIIADEQLDTEDETEEPAPAADQIVQEEVPDAEMPEEITPTAEMSEEETFEEEVSAEETPEGTSDTEEEAEKDIDIV